MSSYKSVSVLEVSLWEHRVGFLMADPGSGYFAFEYDPKFARTGLQPSPLQFPVQSGPKVFPSLLPDTFRRLPAFVSDSLPDRFGNSLIDAWMVRNGLGSSDFTVLDRLAYIGKRSMGALEFAPAIALESSQSKAIEAKEIVEAARKALVIDTHSLAASDDAAIAQLMQVGTSAGGAKAKAVVGYNPASGELVSGQLDLPDGFEHWLIKIDTGDRPYGCIEYAYHLMAIDFGIEMTDCTLLEAAGKQHFMTRRFDRTAVGGKLHMQTLCAMSAMDFNQLRTHDYAQLFETAKRLGLAQDTLDQLYMRMLFNVCMANNDDHPKNISFLMDHSGSWSLAPAYDVMFACDPANKWTACHSMSVNGKFENIAYDDCMALARRFNIAVADKKIERAVQIALKWPDYASHAGVDKETTTQIMAVIEGCVNDLARF